MMWWFDSNKTKQNKTPSSKCFANLGLNIEGQGWVPSWGTKIPHSSRPKNPTHKPEMICNKFNKDFKNGPHPKKKKILKKSCIRKLPPKKTSLLYFPCLPAINTTSIKTNNNALL